MLSDEKNYDMARQFRRVIRKLERSTTHIKMNAVPTTLSNYNTVRVVIILDGMDFVEHLLLPEDLTVILEKGYKETIVGILQHELEHYDVELLYEDARASGDEDVNILEKLKENRRNFKSDVNRILSSSYYKGESVV